MKLSVGFSQIQNNVEVTKNLDAICSSLLLHQKSNTDIVLFPECALTGFTSLVRNTDFKEVEKAVEKIQSVVTKGKTIAVVPSTIKAGENYLNSGYIFYPNQQKMQIFKEGLTESEKKFFIPGNNEIRSIDINGYKIGFLICIEAAHEPWIYLDKNQPPDLILWPAYWGKDELPKWDETLTQDDLLVFKNNKIWNRCLIRATFFENHPNIGLNPGPYGQSLVITDDNHLFYSAKKSLPENSIVHFQRENGKPKIISVEELKG